MKRFFFLLPFVCLAAPATASLVAWYPLDEGSGSQANDASGNGNFMVASSTAWLPTGAFGGSVQLSPGNSLLARTGNAGSLAGLNATTGNKVSIAFWLKPNSESIGENPFYIGDSTTGAGNRLFSTHLEWTDGNTYWDVSWGDGSDQRLAGVLGTVADRLHHYVLTYDGDSGNMSVFKDGVSTLTGTGATQSSLPWASIQNFEIGAASFVAWWPGGQIDDFAIFNHVLSQSEIDSVVRGGVATLVPEPGAALLSLFALGGLMVRRRR